MLVFKIIADVPRTPADKFATIDRPSKTLDYLGAVSYTTIQLSKRMLPDRQLITLHCMPCTAVTDMTALTQVCNRLYRLMACCMA